MNINTMNAKLISAAEERRLEVVRSLIEKGADVDAKDKFKATPLIWAALKGDFEIVKFLIEKGADVDAKDIDKDSPLNCAALNGHFEIVNFLIERGADVDAEDNYKKTPLIFAAGNGHFEIVKFLIEKGADVDAKDIYKKTPLNWAALNGHLEIVKFLIEKGADVNAEDNDNTTPLMAAALNRHSDAAEFLTEKIRENRRVKGNLAVSCVRKNPNVHKTCSKLWENREATGDIKFKVKGVEISAHKCVLAALSPKFERQFYGEFDDKDKKVIEVNQEEVTAAAFEEFLQFFYLNEIHLKRANIEGVLSLAKESLLDEFFDECVKYLIESLSTDNVCLSYDLALLYGCETLIKRCEELIPSKANEVFATDGIINCNRSTLSNILQLVSPNCKATDVFDACILWSKHYCAQNGMNGENNEQLRKAIGDELYKINFGKMTMQEFVKYYPQYKHLFTDEEREEILLIIGKVCDFTPNWFHF